MGVEAMVPNKGGKACPFFPYNFYAFDLSNGTLSASPVFTNAGVFPAQGGSWWCSVCFEKAETISLFLGMSSVVVVFCPEVREI